MALRALCLGLLTVMLTGIPAQADASAGPYLATGIKIGEVTSTEAIVWTRLTRSPMPVPLDAPMPVIRYKNPDTGQLEEVSGERRNWTPVVEYPKGVTVDTIAGAAPGANGSVRVLYKPEDAVDFSSTSWEKVDPEECFARQFKLENLKPATSYTLRVESRDETSRGAGQTVEGRFRTAPLPTESASVSFAVSTGQEFAHKDRPDGFKIYPSMIAMNLDFFVHTGDIVYYDKLAKNADLARWHWDRVYSLPTNVDFHRQTSSYFIKDDHDTWMNDCWPAMKSKYMGEFTFKQGQAIFLEQVPMSRRTYRTFRWGKDLQIWLVEGRDFRSANDMPDGPDKTIWGAKQKRWFKQSVSESDATFRVLISPTPLVGPDRGSKNDNHANAGFTVEGDELRSFIASQKNMVVVCGDRHWQYVSVDSKSGVREYSCGPASDEHAGGWPVDQMLPEHRYLKIVGGFLVISVGQNNGETILFGRHYGVDGQLLNEDRVVAVKE